MLLIGIVIGGAGHLDDAGALAAHRAPARRAEAQRWQAEADRLTRERQAQRSPAPAASSAPVQPLEPCGSGRPCASSMAPRSIAALAYPALVDVLEAAFRQGAIAPLRHHHAIALDGRPEATLLLMPAWEASAPGAATAGRYLGVKSVTVFPDNATRGKPAVFGTYLLCSAETGETLAVMDATRLTAWRTGAASALASRYLSRPDARAPADGRRRRAGAPPHPRACLGAADPRGGDLEPLGPPRPARWPPASPIPASPSASPTTSRRAVRAGRHRLHRHPLGRAADPRRLARARHACRLRRRLPAQHARDRRRGGAPRPHLRRHPHRRLRRGRRHPAAAAGRRDRQGGRARRPLRSHAAARSPGRASPEEITLFKSVGAAIEDLAAAIAVYGT